MAHMGLFGASSALSAVLELLRAWKTRRTAWLSRERLRGLSRWLLRAGYRCLLLSLRSNVIALDGEVVEGRTSLSTAAE